MNRGICEGCRRYSKNDLNDKSWYCAKSLTQQISRVVPGLVLYVKDYYWPVNSSQANPPDWCEYILEQTVAMEDDEVKRSEPSKYFMSQKAQEIAEKMNDRIINRCHIGGGIDQLIGEFKN